MTEDGSGISLDLSSGSARITTKDGDVHVQGLEDTNGNMATGTADTLNRNLLVATDASNVTYTTPLGQTMQGPNYTTWAYSDSSGTPQNWRVDYEAIDVDSGLCGGPDCSDPAFPKLVPLRLTLPTGRYYQFTWNNDSGAELLRVDLPTGGYLAYTYGMSCSSNPDSVNVMDCRQGVKSRTVGQGGTTATWTYGHGGVVTDPYGNDEVHTFDYITDGNGNYSSGTYETQVKYWAGSSVGGAGGTLLKTVVNQYTGEAVPVIDVGTVLGNVRRIQQDTALENGLTRRSQTDYETFTYNSVFGPYTATRLNVTAQREYDYSSGAPPLQRRTTYSYDLNFNAYYTNRNIVDRVTQTVVYDGSGSQLAKTIYEYDNYNHPNQPMLVSGAVQHDSAFNTNYTIRGNVTAVQHWRKTDGALLTTTNQYDDAGNLISTIDPLTHKTTFDYTDSWANGACAPAGQGKAYLTSVTNAANQITRHKYNSCTGSLASTTDPNLQTTSLTYDLLGRVTQTSFPDGGLLTNCFSDVSGTSCYNANPPLTATHTQKVTASLNKIDTTVFDGLGRVIQTQLNSDPDGVTYVDTAYNLVGKVCSVSNPHRSGSASTDGITQYQYDALGRATQVAPPDGTAPVPGSTCPSTGIACGANNVCTSYSGNTTTVTDQAGKARKSQVDGLGRLTFVWEDPAGLNYETDYVYDALGNLMCAVQKGTDTTPFTNCASASATWRPRSFQYDSLSHITSATNPESGTINYSYDNNGNLSTKVAPLPNGSSGTVTTNYQYDVLNRLTSKTYTGMTMPNILFGYDGIAPTGCSPPSLADSYPAGRRTSMCDGSGATSWSHDPMGRVAVETQTQITSSNTSVTKSMSYLYNPDGSVQSVTYPSGRVLSYAYAPPQGSQSAGRVVSIVDSTGPINYVTQATYAPPGELGGSLFGVTTGFAGIATTNSYNNRLQPAVLSASNPSQTIFNLSYGFNPGHNNGNVQQIVNNLDSTRSVAFTYDPLNRISQASTTVTTGSNCWGEGFTIDPWGNLTNRTDVSGMTGCNTEGLNAPVNTNNQITGWCYDAAGNLLDMGACAPLAHSYVYDAENRLQSPPAVNNSTGTLAYTYYYDGDGNRVQKCNANPCTSGSTPGTLYWLGLGGEVLDESGRTGTGSMQEEYVYFNGQRVARRDVGTNNVHYYFADHLGSASLITDSSGNVQQQTDYYPYGGIAYTSGIDTNRYKFTGKERDGESGLDEFGARYYSSALGRFMIPDWAEKPTSVPYANFGNPQSLNLYSYVQNSPTTVGDPDGHACQDASPGGQGTNCNAPKTDESSDSAQDKVDRSGPAPPPPPTPDPANVRGNAPPASSPDSSKGSGSPTGPVVAAGVGGLAPQANGAAQAAKAAAEAVGKQIKPDKVLRSGKDAAKDAMEQSRLRQLAKKALDTLGGIAAGLANGTKMISVPAPMPSILLHPHRDPHDPDCGCST